MDTSTAHDWYVTRHVGDDVTYVGEPYIKEFYRCNMWHVRGRDRGMLVDSGMGVVSLRDYVPLVTEKPCVAVASRIVEDGDVIDLGDRVFTVIHTPGHSQGEIVLWEEATRILFSGDMIYDGPLIDDDVPVYVESMKKIQDLPVRVMHGGHFPSSNGEHYRDIIRQYLEEKGA